jgi:hypothetical protein
MAAFQTEIHEEAPQAEKKEDLLLSAVDKIREGLSGEALGGMAALLTLGPPPGEVTTTLPQRRSVRKEVTRTRISASHVLDSLEHVIKEETKRFAGAEEDAGDARPARRVLEGTFEGRWDPELLGLDTLHWRVLAKRREERLKRERELLQQS